MRPRLSGTLAEAGQPCHSALVRIRRVLAGSRPSRLPQPGPRSPPQSTGPPWSPLVRRGSRRESAVVGDGYDVVRSNKGGAAGRRPRGDASGAAPRRSRRPGRWWRPPGGPTSPVHLDGPVRCGYLSAAARRSRQSGVGGEARHASRPKRRRCAAQTATADVGAHVDRHTSGRPDISEPPDWIGEIPAV